MINILEKFRVYLCLWSVSSGGLKVVFCSTLPEFENFDKCHNLSKRNVRLILKILNNLEPKAARRTKKRCIQLVRV
jgi:hypothetical protein